MISGPQYIVLSTASSPSPGHILLGKRLTRQHRGGKLKRGDRIEYLEKDLAVADGGPFEHGKWVFGRVLDITDRDDDDVETKIELVQISAKSTGEEVEEPKTVEERSCYFVPVPKVDDRVEWWGVPDGEQEKVLFRGLAYAEEEMEDKDDLQELGHDWMQMKVKVAGGYV